MASRTQQYEQDIENLVHDKGWKGHLTIGIIALILGALVSSTLFLVLKVLIEIILFLGGIALILYAIYEYIQLEEKKKK